MKLITTVMALLGLGFLFTGFPVSADQGGIYPGAHRVLHLEQWTRLPVQGVRSIETDLRYVDGTFYLAHDADEEDKNRTLHRLLWNVMAKMPDHFSSEETTFIYLDIKKTGGLRGAARLYAEISRFHQAFPRLNIRWVLTGDGPSSYVMYYKKRPEMADLIGVDLLIKEPEKNRRYVYEDYTIRRDYPDINVQDRDPIAFFFAKTPKTTVLEFYLAKENNHLLADWLGRGPDGVRDSYPIRLWTPNKKSTVHTIIDLVKTAKSNGCLHPERDLYLCSDHDTARQLLWLTKDRNVTGQTGFNHYRDTGRDAAVAAIARSGHQYFVEVHRTHTEGKGLWYSTHRRDLESGELTVLTEAVRYDTGMDPDVALVEHNGIVYVCEVHGDSKRGKNSIWYSWFRLDLDTGKLARKAHGKLFRGRQPAVSLVSANNRVYIVVMNEGDGHHRLHLSLLGLDPDDPGALEHLHRANVGYQGIQPDVAALAVDDGLQVVEVHKSQRHDTLWTARFNFDWSGRFTSNSTPRQYDRGMDPSLSIAPSTSGRGEDEAVVMETHYGGNDRLWYTLTRLGHWRQLADLVSEVFSVPAAFIHGHYDTGRNPSVAIAEDPHHGLSMVEIHETADGKLWIDSWHIAPWIQRIP